MPFGITAYQDREAGQYSGAVGLLQAENLSLNQNFEAQDKLDTLGINSFRYNLYKEPAEVIDEKTREVYLDPITSQKNTILTLGGLSVAESDMNYYGSGSAALSALETLYGTPTDNDGVLSTRQIITSVNWTGIANSTGISVSAGVACSSISGGTGTALFDVSASIGQAARIDLQDTSGSIGVGVGSIFYINGSPVSPPSSLEYAASGEVFEDTVIVLYYPTLYPPDPGAANPLANPQFKILPVNGTDGLGSGQTYYRNSIQGSYGSFPGTDDSLTLLGDAYTVSVNNSDIGDARTEIGTLRGVDLTTGITSYIGAGSTVKEARQEFAINQWSLVKNRVNTQAKINANDAAIGILKNSAFQP